MIRSWLSPAERGFGLSRLRGGKRKTRAGQQRHAVPLSLKELEDRLAPATFQDNGPTLNLVLGTSEQLGIAVGGGSYDFLSLNGRT